MRNLLIDAILFVLFVAELSFHYLPKSLHEILGVAFVVIIIVHIGINFRRFMALFKIMSLRKFFSIEVNVVLLIGVAIILFTGVCMSNYLFPDAVSSAFRRNMTIHNLHTSTPYILMVLIGMHIGLHGGELRQKLLHFFGAENFYQQRKYFFTAIYWTLAAFGLAGLFLNRFLSRILMKHIFSTPATDLIAPLFVLLIVGGVAFFALITRLIVKKIFKE